MAQPCMLRKAAFGPHSKNNVKENCSSLASLPGISMLLSLRMNTEVKLRSGTLLGKDWKILFPSGVLRTSNRKRASSHGATKELDLAISLPNWTASWSVLISSTLTLKPNCCAQLFWIISLFVFFSHLRKTWGPSLSDTIVFGSRLKELKTSSLVHGVVSSLALQHYLGSRN